MQPRAIPPADAAHIPCRAGFRHDTRRGGPLVRATAGVCGIVPGACRNRPAATTDPFHPFASDNGFAMENPIVSGWSDFFVAAAGAAAALAGLVFVSISINLSRIIEARGVSGRAAETMVLLSGALASSLITLFPHIS